MTLFVTHYPQITSLVHMYPNVKNVHLKTAIDATALPAAGARAAATPSASSSTAMKYLHEVGTGPCDMKSGYGLIMAEHSGFPRQVIDDARHFRSVVRDKFPVLLQQPEGSVDASVSALNSLLQQLLLLKNSALDTQSQLQYLNNLRARIPDQVALDTSRWLSTALPSNGRTALSVEDTKADVQGDGDKDDEADSGDKGESGGSSEGGPAKVTPVKNARQDEPGSESPRPHKLKKLSNPAEEESRG